MGVLNSIRKDLAQGALQLMLECRERLYAVAFRTCGNVSDAEDLVSRTFAKAILKLSEPVDVDNLYGWLRTMMLNLHADDQRRAVERGTQVADMETLDACAGADWSTDEEILRNSDGEAVRAALKNLDPEYKEVLILRYYEDLSLKEIAAFLNKPVGTIGRRIHVALKLLVGMLGAKMGKTKKPLAVILVVLLSLVSAAAVATLPAFEPLRATVAGWFGGDATANEEVEVFAEPRTAAVPAAVTPTEGV